MTTPKAPSVINPDIPPLPLPGPTFPSGSRSLSPDNSGSVSTKRLRSVPDNAMDIETTSTRTPDSSIHAQTLPAPTTVASQDDKGKSVAFAIPERQPSPDGNATAIKFTPSRYHAAAYLRDVPDVFKAKFITNRFMCDEVNCSLSCYSSYGVRARYDGSRDNKKILVFFNNQDDFTDCVNSTRADLLDLAFTHYFPADAKLSNEAKSLFVTNIPLFLNETQVRQAFSRYGNVIKCKLTPKKHYYNRHIQFSSANAVTQFNDIWVIICLGNSLRVCPASFSKLQRKSRREHVAILAGILKNIKEADLLEIATHVNAKALNVPLSINSYKPKPYVYLNFSSFDTLEAAKEMTVAFCGKGLTWHLPNEAHTLCHVCRCPGCSPSVCNPHPTRKVDERFNKLSTPASPSGDSAYTLPQHIIDDLKAQIKKIANTLSTLDETVSWMQDTITQYEYRLSEFESMMGYDGPGNSDLYRPRDDNEIYSHDNGWDDEPTQDTSSRSILPLNTSSSLMDTSPDASSFLFNFGSSLRLI
ncbi:hypothetical protein RhiirB3_441962 [Rhizophagus irregularis]|nr:hypothetical protein RhiirB3_441962 [Rhizophagus irregularis]